jgi:hypothetical protein
VGAVSINAQPNQVGLETAVRDLEFALPYVQELAFVNNDKLAAMGRRFGGLAAQILQMRNSDIEAVAGLNSWSIYGERIEFARRCPFFNTNRAAVPMMQAYGGEASSAYDFALIDSCQYSDRSLVEFAHIPARGFTSYNAVQDAMTDTTEMIRTVSMPDYDLACGYILNFFKAHLTSDEVSRQFMSDGSAGGGTDPEAVSVRFLAARELPPTPEQFVNVIQQHGAGEAVALYEKFQASDPGSITFAEATMNALGYRLLQSGQGEEATALFKLNAETYSNSANCWDSYADGCQAIGDEEQAVKCYERVLEVLPNDTLAGEQLKETLRTNAVEGLRRLKGE